MSLYFSLLMIDSFILYITKEAEKRLENSQQEKLDMWINVLISLAEF